MLTTEQRIAKILKYSFDDINWSFKLLTKKEQGIIGDQSMLDMMKVWSEKNAKDGK